MRNISAWSILHPIPPIVLFIMLICAGFIGFSGMAMDENPNIDLPTVSITVIESGAAPSELEIQVTKKVEDAMSGLTGIRHVSSTVSEGSSSTLVEFELGTNTDRAVDDIRDRINRIHSELPSEISEPQIQRRDIAGNAFATYVVSDPNMSTTQLSWYIDNELSRSLLTVSGVGQIQREGGVTREIEINLDPAKLESVGLTAEGVSEQIRMRNANMPGGRAQINNSEQSIRTLASAQTIDELKSLKIALQSGSWTRLDALGTVEDTHADSRQSALYDNQPVVAFSVLRSPGFGLAQVADGVDKRVKEIAPTLPSGLKITRVRTNAQYVKDSFDATIESMILGASLAVFTIWFFLKDWRSALISAIAMPLSVIPTFAVMKYLNFTLNNVSLLGLALVVGILVDDAIVEIENIVRHMQMGKPPLSAALEAADEIGLAVVATTMSIVVVFLPVAFMGGIPGQFFKQFGITVAVAVFFSLIVARLITPMMAANWLTEVVQESATNERFVALYKKCLGWALSHRKLTVCLSVLFFIFSLGLAVIIPTNFIGTADRNETVLNAQLEAGQTLGQSIKVAKILTKEVLKHPEVEHVFASIGTPSESDAMAHASTGAAVNKAELYIVLRPRAQRKFSQSELESILRNEIDNLPGVKLSFSASQGLGGRLQYCLVSTDSAALDAFVPKLVAQMKSIPGLADIDTDSSLRAPQVRIVPNQDLSAQQGITVQTIARTALVSTMGDSDASLGKFDLPDRQLDVRVRLNDSSRGKMTYLRSMKVAAANGSLVPLDSVATVTTQMGPSELSRYDKLREVTISAQLVHGEPLGRALQQIHDLPINRHRPLSITELMMGDVQVQQETFGSFGSAMVIAIVLMYCVLVLLFNDFLNPITIMVSLPLSLGGAIIALLTSGQPLGLYALIGIIMLMGLVAKNAILLVEYALVAMREDGFSASEAVLRAGAARMRPILMTTFAMVAGMVPIALGFGSGAELRAPMAVAVIGGLATSSILTLVVVPTIFVMLNEASAQYLPRWKEKLRSKWVGA